MRIGIDACCWSNRRGFGRYAREIISALIAINRETANHEIRLVVDQQTHSAWDFPTGAMIEVARTSEQPTIAARAHSSRSMVDLWRLSQAARRFPPQIFYFPAVYSYYPPPSRIPSVVTLHDAIAEQYPELIFPRLRSRWAWTLKVKWALAQARTVLTVSESARRQVVDAFGIDPGRIVVTGEGFSEEFRPIDEPEVLRQTRRQYGIPETVPVVLFVGGLSPHKNLDGLIRALAKIRDAGVTEWAMVIVGDTERESFHTCYRELVEQCRAAGLENKVIFTGFISDGDLVRLYNTATLLVLPSFSEGFGLPVVEAMACGLPVAASNQGSLPEVAGSAALYFDPHETDSIAATITTLLSDAELRTQLEAQGRQQAHRHTWRAAANKVLGALEAAVR